MPDEMSGFDKMVTSAVERASPAVVNVSTVRLVQDYYFHVHPLEGMGSGVIIDSRGYLVTNLHVVSESNEVNVTLEGGRRLPGRTIGGDATSDIAIVKVDAGDLKVAELGDSDRLKVGQFVIAIGNPFGFMLRGTTVTTGVVSALNRDVQGPDRVLEDLIQTDAAINPGNSGGALVDLNGRVVGINTAMIPYAQGIGFAIPINTVKRVVEELVKYGRVIRPWLGVMGVTITKELASYYHLPVSKGVLVARVVPFSPAQRAGLQPGDALISVEDEELNKMEDLQKKVQAKKVGDRLSVDIVRGSQRGVVDIVLTEVPQT